MLNSVIIHHKLHICEFVQQKMVEPHVVPFLLLFFKYWLCSHNISLTLIDVCPVHVSVSLSSLLDKVEW